MSDYSFRDFLNHTINLSPADKVKIASEALKTYIDYLKSDGINDEKIDDSILWMTKLFVSADVRLAKDEYDFFRAVTGIDVDAKNFYEITNGGADPEFIEKMLGFIKSMPEKPREAAVSYGMMVMACDENIDFSESDLIKRLLEIL